MPVEVSTIESPTAERRPAFKANPLLRLWRGQAPLWQAFWFVGFAGYFVLRGWFVLTTQILWRPSRPSLGIAVYIFGCWIAYWSCTYVCIWRCAPNTRFRIVAITARVAVLCDLAWTVAQFVRLATN